MKIWGTVVTLINILLGLAALAFGIVIIGNIIGGPLPRWEPVDSYIVVGIPLIYGIPIFLASIFTGLLIDDKERRLTLKLTAIIFGIVYLIFDIGFSVSVLVTFNDGGLFIPILLGADVVGAGIFIGLYLLSRIIRLKIHNYLKETKKIEENKEAQESLA